MTENDVSQVGEKLFEVFKSHLDLIAREAAPKIAAAIEDDRRLLKNELDKVRRQRNNLAGLASDLAGSARLLLNWADEKGRTGVGHQELRESLERYDREAWAPPSQ